MSAAVAVIGGGPAGLMAGETLSRAGLPVDLYEAMPSAGRKFLVAGKGGLNLTHSEPFEQFLERYGSRRAQFEPLLQAFGPAEMRAWAKDLGVETFIGSSGRVFPVGMKSAPLLRAWIQRLRAAGVQLHFRHKWRGWAEDGSLRFETPEAEIRVRPPATILALGGASWPITGSTGEWVPWLAECGIPMAPFKPSNCGFDVKWSDYFSAHFAGAPMKAVTASFTDSLGRSFHQQGEFVITRTGVEGSLVYACSALLRDELEANDTASLHLDLAPGYTQERLAERLRRPRGSRSVASWLEKSAGIKGVKAGLLREFLSRDEFDDPVGLAQAIKDLQLPLAAPRPIEEAISSAGGISFEALDEHLMLKNLAGVFCAGEMLDWEAPTGGYLLTACFSNGRAAALGVTSWLDAKQNDTGGVSNAAKE